MNFISHAQLLTDVRSWSQQLPDDLVAVAGVPRSGLLPALHLALHRNIHLATLEELRSGATPWRTGLRRGVAAKSDGRVLVLDDSVSSGGTLAAVRRDLRKRSDCLFAAVYRAALEPPAGVDRTFREISHPRCFEWNLFHCDQISLACLDMDGVLCEDWTGREDDQGRNHAAYLRHINGAKPLHLPTYPVLAIVTSRLEAYRAQTTDWLARHGVRYGELIMSPHDTAAARQWAADHAPRKAAAYTAFPQARLFVESDLQQARTIAGMTGRPALCSTNMQLF